MNRKTILLVEDDRDSREIYGVLLRRSGYRLLEAMDGGDALLIAREQRPDLIIMDLGLPHVDGWAATESLKSDPETSDIPIVALTVHVQAHPRRKAMAAGCDLFIDKPCSPTRLLREIQQLLVRS